MTATCFPPKAVLFDFDGTLTAPGALNFGEIRRTLGCPPDRPILEYINELIDENQKNDLLAVLEEFEMRGAEISVPNHGAERVIRTLRDQGIGIGIISRNGIEPIRKALQNFRDINVLDFDIIISRNDPFKPKPSAQGVLAAAAKWNIRPSEIVVIGDYLFDIQAGKAAGAVTVFLKNPAVVQNFLIDSDFTVSSLDEIPRMIGIPPDSSG